MRTGGVWYGIELDTLSYVLHHIVGKVCHKTNACAFNDPKEEGFGNPVGKRENAGNQHFLLIPQCFLLYPKEKLSI